MTGDELDRILDEALTSYAGCEPRAGLSGRVLARVESEHKVRRAGWWVWAMAGLAVVCLTLAIGFRKTPVEPVREVLTPPPVQRDVVPPPPGAAPQKVAVVRAVVKRPPKPVSFPSPAPLTQEGRGLLELARVGADAVAWLPQSGKPLDVAPIEIQPLRVADIETGELK